MEFQYKTCGLLRCTLVSMSCHQRLPRKSGCTQHRKMCALLLLIACCISLLQSVDASVSARPAGIPSRDPALLTEGDHFCPNKFSSNGFTIECSPPASAEGRVQYMDMYLNGVYVRRERYPPYCLFGDKTGIANPWEDWKEYKGNTSIMCVSQTYDRTITEELSFMLGCDDEDVRSKSAYGETPPGSLVVLPTGPDRQAGKLLSDGDVICPDDYRTGDFSIECVASSTSTFADFFVDGRSVRRESHKPYYISGDVDGIVFPWDEYPKDIFFNVMCILSDRTHSSAKIKIGCRVETKDGATENIRGWQSEEENADSMDYRSSERCIHIGAKEATFHKLKDFSYPDPEYPPLSLAESGWLETPSGLAIREESLVSSADIVLMYKFKVPVTSYYSIAVDVTGLDRHSDSVVHLYFPDGLPEIISGEESYNEYAEWTDIFHYLPGRGLATKSFGDHTKPIWTRKALNSSKEYEIGISSDSGPVEVHRILLFPCNGKNCKECSPQWEAWLDKCAALR